MKRAVFAAALLPLLAAPCVGQDAETMAGRASGAPAEPPADAALLDALPATAGTIPGRGGADPWSGIVIVVTPPGDDAAPADGAQALGPADDAHKGAAAADPQPAGPVPDDQAADAANDDMPSLWTSLDLGFGDAMTVPAPRKVVTVPTRPVKAAPPQPLPTSFDLRQGPAQFAVVTSVSTSQPVSSALDRSTGGGSGELKGRLGYVLDNWSLYGVGGLGASENTGTLSVYDSLVLGSTYTMPLAPFGLRASDSLGAKIEIGDTQATTTSLEMRSGQGNYQRFIAVERSVAPEAAANDTVRAGVVGKF